MRMKTVEDGWRNYAKNVGVPMEGINGGTQWIETRRAFYAGFTECLIKCRLELEVENEDHGVAQLEALWAECEAFARKTLTGAA